VRGGGTLAGRLPVLWAAAAGCQDSPPPAQDAPWWRLGVKILPRSRYDSAQGSNTARNILHWSTLLSVHPSGVLHTRLILVRFGLHCAAWRASRNASGVGLSVVGSGWECNTRWVQSSPVADGSGPWRVAAQASSRVCPGRCPDRWTAVLQRARGSGCREPRARQIVLAWCEGAPPRRQDSSAISL
jgi:hypothetical protein